MTSVKKTKPIDSQNQSEINKTKILESGIAECIDRGELVKLFTNLTKVYDFYIYKLGKRFVQALKIFYPSNIFFIQAIKTKIVYAS